MYIDLSLRALRTRIVDEKVHTSPKKTIETKPETSPLTAPEVERGKNAKMSGKH